MRCNLKINFYSHSLLAYFKLPSSPHQIAKALQQVFLEGSWIEKPT